MVCPCCNPGLKWDWFLHRKWVENELCECDLLRLNPLLLDEILYEISNSLPYIMHGACIVENTDSPNPPSDMLDAKEMCRKLANLYQTLEPSTVIAARKRRIAFDELHGHGEYFWNFEREDHFGSVFDICCKCLLRPSH